MGRQKDVAYSLVHKVSLLQADTATGGICWRLWSEDVELHVIHKMFLTNIKKFIAEGNLWCFRV